MHKLNSNKTLIENTCSQNVTNRTRDEQNSKKQIYRITFHIQIDDRWPMISPTTYNTIYMENTFSSSKKKNIFLIKQLDGKSK